MRATPASDDIKTNTRQEVFVCVSILIYSLFWLALCIEKYPSSNTGLNSLLVSFLCSITGCAFFLVALICEIPGYQKAAPISLIVGIPFAIIGAVFFDNEYCTVFFSSDYALCVISESLSILIYILTCYYLCSMILSRTNFEIGIRDLKSLKKWFGFRVRSIILLMVNVSMIIVIFIDIRIYPYTLKLNGLALDQLDVLWVCFCVGLSIISSLITLVLLRFQRCVPFVAHRCVLILGAIATFVAFGVGFVTARKYRMSDEDGMAQIANVFIWAVVNLWMFIEFMTTDINTMIRHHRYENIPVTDIEESGGTGSL